MEARSDLVSGGDRIFTGRSVRDSPYGGSGHERSRDVRYKFVQSVFRLCQQADGGLFLAASRALVVAAHTRPRGRVLVVDDDPAVNLLIVMTLSEHGFDTRSAPDGHQALQVLRRDTPDVALLDVYLPDVSGYQLCRRVREDFGDSVGIMLISGERRDPVDRAGGLLLGADDYLVKPFAIDELLARVQRLAQRHRPMSNAVAAQLTRREREVLTALSKGLDQQAIARDLVISPKTVEKHIEHILSKLGVHSRAQAIALALQAEVPAPPVLADVTRLEDIKRRGALSG